MRALAFLTPQLPFSWSRPSRIATCTATATNQESTSAPLLAAPDSPLHSPVVHRYAYDDGSSYAMWYTAQPTSEETSVKLATSPDGLEWEHVSGPLDGSVLRVNDEQWWSFDTRGVRLGDVFTGSSAKVRADGGVVFLYYVGGDQSQSAEHRFRGNGNRIGVAISKDGEHFSRLEGEFPSGAILDVGTDGEFDEICVEAPCVTSCSDGFVMHYHTYCDAKYRLGRAVSKDGILFRKTGPITLEGGQFASGGVLNPCIIARKQGFTMFVQSINDVGASCIAMTESEDCERWGPLTCVLEPSRDGWDAGGVGCPSGVQLDDGSLRLYYVGEQTASGGSSAIGLAVSTGPDWTSFRKVSKGDIIPQ